MAFLGDKIERSPRTVAKRAADSPIPSGAKGIKLAPREELSDEGNPSLCAPPQKNQKRLTVKELQDTLGRFLRNPR